MWNPDSCFSLFDNTDVAVRLPGPRGAGEIQAIVERGPDGVRTGGLHEVVHFEPERRAVTRSLVSEWPSWGALTLAATASDSCRLTQEFWMDLPAGVPVGTDEQVRNRMRLILAAMMHRLPQLTADQLE
jgi:hypothetical protein